MTWIVEPERKTAVIAETDVLVCGGGFAGVAAAVAAARNGKSVMLIERYGFLGGLATGALVITTPPLNNGINAEIARRLMRWNAYATDRNPTDGDPSDDVDGVGGLVPYDPEALKVEFVRMLQERQVDILLHSYIVGALTDDAAINGVVVENKAGRQAIRARIVIDATGDADIVHLLGAPYRVVEKPITMMFNMADVDTERALADLKSWNALKKIMRQAAERGDLDFSLGVDPEFGAPGVYAARLVHDGQLNVWGGMFRSNAILDPAERTRAEIVTRDHAFRMSDFLKRTVPGFERARLEQMSTEVGIRATRIVDGLEIPSKDAVQAGRFPDTVVRPYKGRPLALPYGSLVPKGVDGLFAAGRCVSADEAIMGRLRLIPVCSATGEAAGVAAALCLDHGVQPRALDAALLQRALAEQGVELGVPE